MRLIDVDKLKEVLFPEDASGGFWGYGTLEEILDQQLTINAEPVRHGKWIPIIDDYINCSLLSGYKCSLCGRYEEKEEPYCNCGAKMNGD